MTEELPRVLISDLRAELVGQRVQVAVQIVGEADQKSIPRKIDFICNRCDSSIGIDFLSQEKKDYSNIGSISSLIFYGEKSLIELNSRCSCGKIDKRYRVETYTDYAEILVRDLPGKAKFDLRKYKPRKVYLIGHRLPTTNKVLLTGQILTHPKTRDITLICDKIEPQADDVDTFKTTDSDRDVWPRYFNETADLTLQIDPNIVGEARKMPKMAALLVLHSPCMIPDVSGQPMFGGLRVAFIGDSTTGKSDIGADITGSSKYDVGFNFGDYFCAESGSRTGLTYSIDNDNKTVVWGSLPVNDKGLLVIDGMQNLPPEDLAQCKEAFRQNRIVVRRSQSGDALARTRLIATMNSRRNKPMTDYVYRCQAVKEADVFQDYADMCRWDLFFVFAAEDVDGGIIAHRQARDRPIPKGIFERHIFWVWSRQIENIIITNEAKDEIKKVTEDFMSQYLLSSLPIINNGSRDVITKLSVAYAALIHSTDSTHEKIIIEAKHVKWVKSWMSEVLEDLQLSGYVDEVKGNTRLLPNEFEDIIKGLGDTEWKILDFIKFSPSSSTILADKVGISSRRIKDHYSKLAEYKLIDTKPKVGVTITPRGIQILKFLKGGAKSNGEVGTAIVTNQGVLVTKNVTASPLEKVPPSENEVDLDEVDNPGGGLSPGSLKKAGGV